MWLNRSKEKERIKFRKEQREGLRYGEFQINTAESSQSSEVKPTGRLLKKKFRGRQRSCRGKQQSVSLAQQKSECNDNKLEV